MDPPPVSWKSGKTAWWKSRKKKRKKEIRSFDRFGKRIRKVIEASLAKRLWNDRVKGIYPRARKKYGRDILFSLARGKEIIIMMMITTMISGTNREERCGKCGAGGR